MVGRSVGRRGVGRRRALSDGGRRTDGSFYFFLEPPVYFFKNQENGREKKTGRKIVCSKKRFLFDNMIRSNRLDLIFQKFKISHIFIRGVETGSMCVK